MAVGHAGDVVGHRAGVLGMPDPSSRGAPIQADRCGCASVAHQTVARTTSRARSVVCLHLRVAVQVAAKRKCLSCGRLLSGHVRTENDTSGGCGAHIVRDRSRALAFSISRPGAGGHVVDLAPTTCRRRIASNSSRLRAEPCGWLLQALTPRSGGALPAASVSSCSKRQQARAHAVVDVVRVA